MSLKNKIEIIDEIVKRHPSYGVEKGWSKYVGGMADTGEWFFRKMLDVPEPELQEFLNDIISQENKPKIPLTPDEERDEKIIHHNPDGSWESELHRKGMNAIARNIELKLSGLNP